MSRYFEDFELGARYPTRSRTITEADHAAFCRLTGYDLPIFLDDAAARQAGLPGKICPSHLIMSFTSPMTGELFAAGLIALVGIEGARFLAMVRPGDTLRVEVEVLEKRASAKPDRGIVVLRDHVLNQRDEEVFRNDKLVLMRKRTPDA